MLRASALMVSLICAFATGAEPSEASDSLGSGSPERSTVIEEVVVTGSRILRDPVNEPTAIMQIGAAGLARTRPHEPRRRLAESADCRFRPRTRSSMCRETPGSPRTDPVSAQARCSFRCATSGRNGPWCWSMAAAGLPARRQSGVPGTVDLNTLPDNVIHRIEILQDGASAVYGSDAIGGVVNIITDAAFAGFEFQAQTGGYLKHGDGESTALGLKWGGR